MTRGIAQLQADLHAIALNAQVLDGLCGPEIQIQIGIAQCLDAAANRSLSRTRAHDVSD